MIDSFERALSGSVFKAYDGDRPVEFERLSLEPPKLERAFGRDFLLVDAASLSTLAERAFFDIQMSLRPSFVATLAQVVSDPSSDSKDSYVCGTLLRNAAIASKGVFPLCQDTGTATVFGWKGGSVLMRDVGEGAESDFEALASGAARAWKKARLRNSQVAPLPGLDERNTGDNSPASIHVYACEGAEYRFLFVAKGGGSANKTRLWQETKRLLGPGRLEHFIAEAVGSIGVSACPPYRIALILGGQSAEETTLAAKMASAGALDALPASPGTDGGPYRDRDLEAAVLRAAAASGWGAQLGGRLLAHDARVVRLPRHAASLPVALAVSCSAHRQAYAYVSKDGFFVERLSSLDDIERALRDAERPAAPGPAAMAALESTAAPSAAMAALESTAAPEPAAATTSVAAAPSVRAAATAFGTARRIDLGEPGSGEAAMAIRSLRAGELVELWGKAVLVRDAVHARIQALLDSGAPPPRWAGYPAFYASPTGAPDGAAVGSIGPTTSRRMDSYLDEFMRKGIFPLTIGKGERGEACAKACGAYGGAYLAAIGGAAALAATSFVASCEVIDWPEFGMEAVRLVELSGFPAVVVCDSTGADYYAGLPLSRQRR